MFGKKPSFDQESPLQELSQDQLSQVAGGCNTSDNDSMMWNKWKHNHMHKHHHHNHMMQPTEIEIIVKEGNTTKKYYEHW